MFDCSEFSQSPLSLWSALRKTRSSETQGFYYWDRIFKGKIATDKVYDSNEETSCQFQKYFGLTRKYQQREFKTRLELGLVWFKYPLSLYPWCQRRFKRGLRFRSSSHLLEKPEVFLSPNLPSAEDMSTYDRPRSIPRHSREILRYPKKGL